jgi:serine/threonine protein kinase
VLRELAGTLVILHRRGIAHGDLKPGNILVARDCAPTLIDFGSAHDSQGAGPPPLLTRTPAWAGPGQMRGHPATAADDVFAFAMLCYRLLENTHPFNGHSVATARDAGHARPSLRRGGRRLRRLVNSVLGGHPASAEDFDAELTSLEGKRL